MISSFKPEFFGDSNGVISYLINLSNPTIDELVDVVVKDYDSIFLPTNILYSSTTSSWRSSTDAEGNFIYIHLLQHHLLIKSYTIQQYGYDDKLKKWVLEGSNDGNEWIVLDSQPPSSDFCVNNKYYTFHALPGIYSYFKIRQSGPNCNNKLFMRLSGLELFGELFSPSDLLLCCSLLNNPRSDDSCEMNLHDIVRQLVPLFIFIYFLIIS